MSKFRLDTIMNRYPENKTSRREAAAGSIPFSPRMLDEHIERDDWDVGDESIHGVRRANRARKI